MSDLDSKVSKKVDNARFTVLLSRISLLSLILLNTLLLPRRSIPILLV